MQFFLVYLHFVSVFRTYDFRYKMDTLGDRTSGSRGGRACVGGSLKTLVTAAVATSKYVYLGCVIRLKFSTIPTRRTSLGYSSLECVYNCRLSIHMLFSSY